MGIIYYVIIFMYVFAFKIYSIIDSTIIVGFFLTIYAIINKSYRKVLLKCFCNKTTLLIGIISCLIFAWSMIVTTINGAYDFTYLKTFLHFLISIFIGYEVVGYFKYKEKADKLVNCVIVAFIIQTILQWIFFIFPEFSQLFNPLRSEAMVEKSIELYSGYRGIAITTSGFFSLSSAYGVVLILYFTKYNTLFKNNLVKYLIFALLVSGTFFAGRTSLVGLIFIPFLFYSKDKKIFSKANLKNLFMIFIVLVLFIVFVYITRDNPSFSRLYNYAFEMFDNLASGEGLQTESTNVLKEMYDIEISPKTFLFGDGKYTEVINGENRYYMQTDAGYFRKILYFGIFGFVLSFALQIVLFRDTKKSKEAIILFLFLMVLEIKGEIIGFNIMVNSIIVLFAGIALSSLKSLQEAKK